MNARKQGFAKRASLSRWFASQKCHQCGEIVQKSLSVRTHLCPFCGYVADRDVNAAKNILLQALLAGVPPSVTS